MTSLLDVESLRVSFSVKRGTWGRRVPLVAVRDVSFRLDRGETLGIVGESGSGKSTMARAVLGLTDVAAGSLRFDGAELPPALRHRTRSMRRDIQMVFQDPYTSLDPSMRIVDIVGEPLDVHRQLPRRERAERVAELLEQVGLPSWCLSRRAHEFSGGQRQRIAIARALAVDPRLVVCDEAVSALDVSTQAQVVQLLKTLQAERGAAMLFIAHDLAVARHVSDRIAVMYLGKVVEIGPSEQVFSAPEHPYTQALLAAAPYPDPVVQRHRKRTLIEGEIPDPAAPPSGCSFRTRCPRAVEACGEAEPSQVEVAAGHVAACHFPDEAR